MKWEIGDRVHDGHSQVRIMAKAEGWLMVRRHRAMPFVIREKELTERVRNASQGNKDESR